MLLSVRYVYGGVLILKSFCGWDTWRVVWLVFACFDITVHSYLYVAFIAFAGLSCLWVGHVRVLAFAVVSVVVCVCLCGVRAFAIIVCTLVCIHVETHTVVLHVFYCVR